MQHIHMNGRPEIRYAVVSDPTNKSYKSANVPKRFVTVWSMLKPGMEFTCREFCDSHKDDLPKNQTTAISLVGRALAEASRVGILNKVEDGHISEEFLNMRTVTFWLGQLRGSTRTNMTGIPSSTTRTSYVRHLWHFNKWLVSRTHVLHVTKYSRSYDGSEQIPDMPWRAEPTDSSSNTETSSTIENNSTIYQARFNSVEDLIELLAKPMTVRADVAIIVKQYLMDPIHKGKRASTICSTRNAILSYFRQNEQRLDMSFDPITTYDNSEIIQMLTLQNMHDMLTIGQPTAAEKAVMMCKLHRGLDVSTLIDRFNFEAWSQITEYFGTEEYSAWNLDMCPVPITLTRLKTGYTHLGFLERDAVTAIQKYLNWRRSKTKKEMDKSQPLFLTKTLKPIGNGWVTNAFSKLAWRSGVQQKIGKNSWRVDSHEMRSLLKSTLIECGCRMDIADHVIGHKPKDSYEKQAILYGDSVRAEYAKASHMLNIFSKTGELHKPDKRREGDIGMATNTHDASRTHHELPHAKYWNSYESLISRTNETTSALYVGAKDKQNMDCDHYSNHHHSHYHAHDEEESLRDVIIKLASLSKAYTEEFQSVLSTLVAKDDGNNNNNKGSCHTSCNSDNTKYRADHTDITGAAHTADTSCKEHSTTAHTTAAYATAAHATATHTTTTTTTTAMDTQNMTSCSNCGQLSCDSHNITE